jgi:NAD(P)-dependent dehydrogenase (short-subunit alcohol dehydrogenase family)
MDITVEQKAALTPADLLDRAVALKPLLRKHTATGEISRRAPEDFELVTSVNTLGFFHTTQWVISQMLAQGGG